MTAAARMIGRVLLSLGCVGCAVFFVTAIVMALRGVPGGPELWLFAWVPALAIGVVLAWVDPLAIGDAIRSWLRWVRS